MLTVQEMLDIAARWHTAMADAMAVCLAWSVETGVPLALRPRPAHAPGGERPAEGVPWRRMVERNADTRWQHV